MSRLLRGSGVALLALAAALPLRAQSVDAGIKGGLVLAKTAESNVQGLKMRTAPGGGGFLTFHLTPGIAVQPEVLYVGKGVKGTEEGVEVSVRLGYIEVPLLARIEPSARSSGARPYVIVGPAIAFKTGCSVKGSGSGVEVAMSCDQVEGTVKSTDFSITGGAGLGFPLGRVHGLLEGRYDLGLSNIDDTGMGGPAVKNRAFMFFAGISFPVGARSGAESIRRY